MSNGDGRTYRKGLEIGWKLASLRKKPENQKICKVCFTKYRRRGTHGIKSVCCSVACKAEYQKIIPSKRKGIWLRRVYKNCNTCGKEFLVYISASLNGRKYCSWKCCRNGNHHPRGNKHYNYKGGIRSDGYRTLRINKRNQLEHRNIFENILGRRLNTNECVHHINGNRSDNRIENLKLMTRSEHSKLHHVLSGK